MAQWLRICLPMQGTRVRALVREDPTCRGATKPVHHNYWACALELVSHNYWAHMPQLLKPARLEPVLRNKRSPRSPQLEKTRAEQGRPSAAKNEWMNEWMNEIKLSLKEILYQDILLSVKVFDFQLCYFYQKRKMNTCLALEYNVILCIYYACILI